MKLRVWRTIQVGCGGIGGPFAMMASKILNYDSRACPLLHLIDGDNYEKRNRERQMVYAPGADNKAHNLAELLVELGHPANEIRARDSFIESADHFAGMLMTDAQGETEWQVVALCLDNDATRHFVYKAVEMTHSNILVIDMANELHHGDVIAHVWASTIGEETPWNWFPANPFKAFPQLESPGDRPPQAYCQAAAPIHPQLVTTNAMAAVIGARILYDFLDATGVASYVTFNMSKLKMKQEV